MHLGAGVLQTDYGPLDFAEQQYLVLPRGTAHRFVPSEPTFLLVIASNAPVIRPDFGLAGRHAVVDPRMLVTPEPSDEPRWTGRPTPTAAGGCASRCTLS